MMMLIANIIICHNRHTQQNTAQQMGGKNSEGGGGWGKRDEIITISPVGNTQNERHIKYSYKRCVQYAINECGDVVVHIC